MKGTASDKICDAMLILLKEKRLDEISIKELTALAGVNRSSYSYHFYCKEDVIEAILDRFNSGLGTIFYKCFSRTDASKEVYTEVKRTVLVYYKEHIDEVKTVCASGFEGVFTRKFLLTLEELFHQLVYTVERDNGEKENISSGALYDMKIKQIVHGILAAVEYWELYKFVLPVEDVISLANEAEGLRFAGASFKSRTGKIHMT